MHPHSANGSKWLIVLGCLASSASTPASADVIGQLSDPAAPATEAAVDILSAWVEQDGGRLTFGIETRGNIPTSVPPEETLTFLWMVDADNDPATGQPHDGLGSEFNVRAVISPLYGGGFVDVTGSLPGGDGGLPVTIDGNRIELTIWLSRIAAPSHFHWRCDAARVVDGMVMSYNGETAFTEAAPSPYTPPARVTVTTPLLMLSMSGPSSGMLDVVIRDAAGNILPNAEHVLGFRSSNEVSATVDATGLVTAHWAPVYEWQVAYVDVWADDLMADNAAVIRVTQTDLGLDHQTYPGVNIAYYLPPVIEGVDLAALTAQYQVVEATDRAYAAQQAGIGDAYVGEGLLYLVLDVADSPGAAPCGASGNPIRLGWEMGKPAHNSCFIINDPANRTPQWFVIFHEMGHDFTASCNAFNMFLWTPSPNHNTAFNEGLASLGAMWTWQDLTACRGNLGHDTVTDINQQFSNYMSAWRQSLADYRNAGANYDNLDADVLDGILLDMYDRYGPKVWFDLFSTFLPSPEALPYAMDSIEKQATWFVAAVSASAGADLRATFCADYGFPVDDAAWSDIWPIVQAKVAARTWVARARPDLDCDGDVDLGDLDLFQACAGGPAIPLALGCDNRDFDLDLDIDQSDFGFFQRCWSGENNPADPNCAR
jgi:hypothetical protein